MKFLLLTIFIILNFIHGSPLRMARCPAKISGNCTRIDYPSIGTCSQHAQKSSDDGFDFTLHFCAFDNEQYKCTESPVQCSIPDCQGRSETCHSKCNSTSYSPVQNSEYWKLGVICSINNKFDECQKQGFCRLSEKTPLCGAYGIQDCSMIGDNPKCTEFYSKGRGGYPQACDFVNGNCTTGPDCRRKGDFFKDDLQELTLSAY